MSQSFVYIHYIYDTFKTYKSESNGPVKRQSKHKLHYNNKYSSTIDFLSSKLQLSQLLNNLHYVKHNMIYYDKNVT
jgi:antirestriction protein